VAIAEIRSMIRAGLRGAVALLLALAVAGCGEWQAHRDLAAAEYGTVPAPGYKTDILALMRTYLNDPVGVRDAFISEPALRPIEHMDRYTVCVRYTARKGGGQYAPSKDSLVLFRQGRVDHLVDAAKEACKDAAYQPFPELEHLTR
jgi:hypothetical protein